MGNYTFGSPEGVAAVKEANAATGEDFRMTLAVWSEDGKREFRTLYAAGTNAEGRRKILDSIDGGGDATSYRDPTGRVGFTFDAETFGIVVDGLAGLHDNGSGVALDLLSSIAESLDVEWI